MTPLLSIVLAAHKEGLIAHKTMLSIERATKKLKEENLPFDIVVTVDSGDKYTAKYFERYADSPNISVLPVQFGDLAMSRNYGISKASGRYIATLDADDLVSENWFVAGVNMLRKQNKPTILHTQYSINFGTQNIIWEKFDSRTKEEDAVIMTWANRWDSAVIAAREVFERFPYEPNRDGYGSEDWHFNSETLAASIPHKVVPETVLFVRRKDISEMTIQSASRRTLRYTDLLDFDLFRSINPQEIPITQGAGLSARGRSAINLEKVGKKAAKKIYTTSQRVPYLSTAARKAKDYTKSTFGYDGHPSTSRFPDWLMTEWRDIHTLEKAIFPEANLIRSIPIYESEMYDLGFAYKQLVDQTTSRPDYVILVPYLSRGGADLVAINYASTLNKLHPDLKIALVATEDQESPWIDRLPSGVDFVSFGSITSGFSEDLRLQLLARFLVQSKAKSIHIIQSPLAFRFAELYETLLNENDYRVYAAAFCEDTDNQGRIAGHVHSGIPYAYRSIDKVFSDNDHINHLLIDEYAFDPALFTTHYQPTSPSYEWRHTPSDDKVRLLWAGRISKQKRPDILINIAQKLDANKFSIDVYGSFQDGYSESYFEGIDTIDYRGGFDGIHSLSLTDYAAYLYTSENDGLPNTLLEIGAGGMPIIAPAIGGIPELIINEETGFLISNYEDVDEYISAIIQISEQPDQLQAISSNIKNLIADRHSIKQFESYVKKDIAV